MNFRLPPLSRNDFQMKEMEVLKEKLESKKPIDLIHVTCHLCKRLRVDRSKAMSRGISGGKQATKFANTSNRAGVCLFSPKETTI